MSTAERIVRLPERALEYANILLTTGDATVGSTPRDVVWTHRKTTLYRYRSPRPVHPVPILLVFALINRPDIFDLRPGSSFVEYLLGEEFDVFLVDWARRSINPTRSRGGHETVTPVRTWGAENRTAF